VRQVDRAEWGEKTVGDVMQRRNEADTLTPDLDAAVALRRIAQGGSSTVMVVENDVLKGVLSQADIMKYIGVKLDLEEEEEGLASATRFSPGAYRGMQHRPH
jgi:CBS-domain-containing membrane protein